MTTMNETDKVRMTINIGGEHIQLAVPYNSQVNVRNAEKAASDLFDAWRLKWPRTSDKELLARIAYKFAASYLELIDQCNADSLRAEEISASLDSLIAEHDVNA